MVGHWMTYVILGSMLMVARQSYFDDKNINYSVVSDLDNHIIQKDVTYVISPGIPFTIHWFKH